MKKILLLIALIAAITGRQLSAQDSSEPDVTIKYPGIKSTLYLTGKPLHLSGVLHGGSKELLVNGAEAVVDDDGTFIVYPPLNIIEEEGKPKAKFVFETGSGSSRTEKIFIYNVVLPPETSPADELVIDESWQIQPSVDMTLNKGEIVTVEVKATPDADVSFTVEGYDGKFDMPETEEVTRYFWGDAVFGEGFSGIDDTVSGIYRGSFRITKPLSDSQIEVTVSKEGLGTTSKILPSSISVMQDSIPVVVRTGYNPNRIIARVGAQKGYDLFLDEGINLLVNGRKGDWVRVSLQQDKFLYVPEDEVELMPAGTPPPEAEIYAVRTKDFDEYVQVSFGFSERVPYKVILHKSPQSLELQVFNVRSNIDWVFHDTRSTFVKEVTWTEPENNTLKFMIYLDQKTHWGYSMEFDHNTLKLKINKPALDESGFLGLGSQLEGRRIVLDPGHNPDPGAIGNRGLTEKKVNLEISLKLKEMLESSGAEVYLTHEGEGLGLRERYQKVISFNPDISISIHNNAVPFGVNPIEHNGSSVYYYYPQALPLARMIHNNFLEELELKNFGLYWDNLYMCRIPDAIALLVEPAFMIMPGQERLLMSDEFREKIAEAIYNAIEEFYEVYSE